MKILILADVFFPDTIGGAGRVAYHLAYELSRKQHQVHVITRNVNNRLLSYERLNPCLHIHRFFMPQDESLHQIFQEIKGGLSIVKRLSSEIHFDLVCIHQCLAAIGPMLSGCLKDLPAIYYFHSPWHEEFLLKRSRDSVKPGVKVRVTAFIMRFIEKRVLHKTSRVIVLSKFMSDKVSRIHNYPDARIRLIPGGVDLDYFHPPVGGKEEVKKELLLPLDKTILLTVRNLVPRMGLENLLEAFGRSEILMKRCLLLIGGTGFLEGRLKKIAERLNLGESISFLGHIPQETLPKIYQAADYFILPTENLEGFGLVIPEAMSCGTPVVGTPVGAIEEIIGQFHRGLMFRGTGWKDLKDKLEEVVEQADRYKFEPAVLRGFVEKRYSWKRVADAFEKEAAFLIGDHR